VSVVLMLLVLVSAPIQTAITTALFRDPIATPVVPVALIAAWASMRRVEETWPAILLPAIALGATSEERAGWFLLALLPAPALALLGTRRLRPRVTGIGRRLAVAATVAAAGACAYVVLLSAAGGVLTDLPAHAAALLAAAAGSAFLALLVALALWPLRRRDRGLFV